MSSSEAPKARRSSPPKSESTAAAGTQTHEQQLDQGYVGEQADETDYTVSASGTEPGE